MPGGFTPPEQMKSSGPLWDLSHWDCPSRQGFRGPAEALLRLICLIKRSRSDGPGSFFAVIWPCQTWATVYTVGVPQSGQNLPATILRQLGQNRSPAGCGCPMGLPHWGQNLTWVGLA